MTEDVEIFLLRPSLLGLLTSQAKLWTSPKVKLRVGTHFYLGPVLYALSTTCGSL